MDVDRVTFEHWFKFKVAWSRDSVSRSGLTQIAGAAFISDELRQNPLPQPQPLSVSCFNILRAVSSLNFIFIFARVRGRAFPPRGHTFQFDFHAFRASNLPNKPCHHLWTDLPLPRERDEKQASSKKGYNDENRNMIMPATWAAR